MQNDIMKKNYVVGIICTAVFIVVAVLLVSRYITRRTPTLLQGTVECTTYKASSKIPGRIAEMKVEEGDSVEKGQLLYVLSTPELDAKLRQAEAVKSAASALDQAAIAGARKQPLTKEKRVVIPSEIVDKSNAAKFYFPDSAY